jgi:hypothetical protein
MKTPDSKAEGSSSFFEKKNQKTFVRFSYELIVQSA